MEANVLDWEPGLALFVPDDDPLRFYRRIARLGCDLLLPGGKLYFEINQAYGRETAHILEMNQYRDVRVIKDIFGKDMEKRNLSFTKARQKRSSSINFSVSSWSRMRAMVS